MEERKNAITSLTLIPSGGGAFEITVDENLIWSKKKTREFPDYEKIASALGR